MLWDDFIMKVIIYRFENVLCRVVTFLLHPILHEVNAQLQVEVLFLQGSDLLQGRKSIKESNMNQTKNLVHFVYERSSSSSE